MIYGCLPASHFAQSEFGDGRLTQLVNDSLQMACHSPARQRRLIPKWLQVVQRHPQAAKLRLLARWLAAWYVILGFHLELYEPYEYREAHL